MRSSSVRKQRARALPFPLSGWGTATSPTAWELECSYKAETFHMDSERVVNRQIPHLLERAHQPASENHASQGGTSHDS